MTTTHSMYRTPHAAHPRWMPSRRFDRPPLSPLSKAGIERRWTEAKPDHARVETRRFPRETLSLPRSIPPRRRPGFPVSHGLNERGPRHREIHASIAHVSLGETKLLVAALVDPMTRLTLGVFVYPVLPTDHPGGASRGLSGFSPSSAGG